MWTLVWLAGRVVCNKRWREDIWRQIYGNPGYVMCNYLDRRALQIKTGSNLGFLPLAANGKFRFGSRLQLATIGGVLWPLEKCIPGCYVSTGFNGQLFSSHVIIYRPCSSFQIKIKIVLKTLCYPLLWALRYESLSLTAHCMLERLMKS